MTFRLRALALVAAGAFLVPVTAQDSVSNGTCIGGDALTPWDDATAPDGSEQCNNYVVDLTPFTASWGTEWGIAPIVKSSKVSSDFNNNIISAQGISRLERTGQSIAGNSYDEWCAAGAGINNVNNDPGTSTTTVCDVNSFGVGFAEFGTSDAPLSQNYNGVVGARVAYQPTMPGRLYVERILAASNSCDPASNLASFGFGAVNEDGEVFFRVDSFGATGGCGLTLPAGNDIYSVDISARDCDIQNVISDDSPGLKDVGALSQYVAADADVHNAPNCVPAQVAGGPFYIGGNFATEYVFGPPGGVSTALNHLCADANDQRGNVGYTSRNFGLLGSTNGVAAHLGINAVTGASDLLNIWGLDALGQVSGTLCCQLPPSITDNDDGFITLGPAGTLEFDHYHSQVAFGGGNGQVALGYDSSGDLLAAATFDHPSDGGTDWFINGVGVCKVDATTGAETWTLAGWNDGLNGKAIKDGPGGAVIGQMVPLLLVTGGAPNPIGPSISAPMIDSAGNVWFTSAVELFVPGGPSDFDNALLRAVYDEASFKYELELVVSLGDVFEGQNSKRDWQVSFISIADSNSVSSGAAWSGNIKETDADFFGVGNLPTSDPRTNGGVVLNAEITYDVDDDGDFTTCFNGGADEDYNVLLYIGPCAWENVGGAKARANGVFPKMSIKGNAQPGSNVTVSLRDMEPNEQFFIIIGFSSVFSPFKFGTLVPSPDVIFPALPTGPTGNFDLPTVWPAGVLPCFDLWYQTWITGPSIAANFSATNGVHQVTP